MLAANEKGLLFHRDELSGWLGNFDRYGGNDGERAFWVESYGGRAYVVDRVKHKNPINIPRLHVAILGGIQPDPLSKLLRTDDDGLAARFLWLWPNPIPPHRPNNNAGTNGEADAFKRISQLSMQESDGGKIPKF